MKTRLVAAMALALFAFGIGVGLSGPAAASDCTNSCRSERIECRYDCSFSPPEYHAYCYANCDALYAACMQSCGA
jgi:hypothetical protein